MSSDWIIIGAVVVLLVGVVLAFKSAAQDTPPENPPRKKHASKGVIPNS